MREGVNPRVKPVEACATTYLLHNGPTSGLPRRADRRSHALSLGRPTRSQATYSWAGVGIDDLTRGRCKALGGPVSRGDKPIKPGDSWFSAKCI